jgi:hypothetical protein
MRKIHLAASAIALLFVFNACSKNKSSGSTPSNARTVQNFSGTYKFADIKASVAGITIDVLDTLPACEKDNVIRLDTDLIAHFIDTLVQCTPPSDSTGKWSLSQNTDTLYVAGGANFINSWDGTTLVLVGNQIVSGFSATITTTLVKE